MSSQIVHLTLGFWRLSLTAWWTVSWFTRFHGQWVGVGFNIADYAPVQQVLISNMMVWYSKYQTMETKKRRETKYFLWVQLHINGSSPQVQTKPKETLWVFVKVCCSSFGKLVHFWPTHVDTNFPLAIASVEQIWSLLHWTALEFKGVSGLGLGVWTGVADR